MKTRIQEVTNNFGENVKSVKQLIDFDRFVLDVAIKILTDLELRLKQHHKIDNPHLSAQSAISALQNVQINDSLRLKYKTMFNQCEVLLVSYLASTIRELFSIVLESSLEKDDLEGTATKEVKLSFFEIQKLITMSADSRADFLIDRLGISCQDMQSITRFLKEYIAWSPHRDVNIDTIIFAQAARHAIVHNGSIADRRFISQIDSAKSRTIMTNIKEGDEIEFKPDEVKELGLIMIAFIGNMAGQIVLWSGN